MPGATPRERRHFTAEFKLEAVRRAEERRAAGVPLAHLRRILVADARQAPPFLALREAEARRADGQDGDVDPGRVHVGYRLRRDGRRTLPNGVRRHATSHAIGG